MGCPKMVQKYGVRGAPRWYRTTGCPWWDSYKGARKQQGVPRWYKASVCDNQTNCVVDTNEQGYL